MPYQVDFCRQNRVLRARFHGQVTEDDLRHFIQTGPDDVALTQPAAALIDMTEVTSLELSAVAIGKFARIRPIIPDPNVYRVIIAPNSYIFGMSRMFELQADSHPNIHVVRTEREACAILGAQNLQFEPLRKQ